MVSVISFILGSVEEMSRSEHWRKAQDHLSQRTERDLKLFHISCFLELGKLHMKDSSAMPCCNRVSY